MFEVTQTIALKITNSCVQVLILVLRLKQSIQTMCVGQKKANIKQKLIILYTIKYFIHTEKAQNVKSKSIATGRVALNYTV